MAEAKDKIVTYGGKIVVMGGKIIMGPCDKAQLVFMLNGITFLAFKDKIDAEKVSQEFSHTTTTSDSVYGGSTVTQTSNVEYLPLDGEFEDGGSYLHRSEQDALGHSEYSFSNPRSVGVNAIRLIEIQDGLAFVRNLGTSPREGLFLLELSVAACVDVGASTYSHRVWPVDQTITSNTNGTVAEYKSVFIEFAVEQSADGKPTIASQRILSSVEANAEYGDKIAFVDDKYTFAGGWGLYLKGTFDMDATVTIEKIGGNDGN